MFSLVEAFMLLVTIVFETYPAPVYLEPPSLLSCSYRKQGWRMLSPV